MNTLKNIKLNSFRIFASFLVFILVPLSSYATHIVGGDITYKFISRDEELKQNTYQILLTLRRDESKPTNVDFDLNAGVAILKHVGSKVIAIGFIPISRPKPEDINEGISSNCGFIGDQIKYQEATYIDTITLDDNSQGGYSLVYQRCCRNETINNIPNPLNTGMTLSVRIDNLAYISKNSSPFFDKFPAVYICANQPLDFDFSARDLDGDSLGYKICPSKVGLDSVKFLVANTVQNPINLPPYEDITYKPPFSLSNLMLGEPLKIDAKTGRMTAIPNLVGQFVVAVCVEEFRNGIKIGEIRREFQYNVRICSTPPTASFDAPSNLCDRTEVEFKNNSLSYNKLKWFFNFPDSSSINTTTEVDPKFNFPGPGTYNIKLRVIRDIDKCMDEEIKTIRIVGPDKPYVADFTYDIQSCNADGTSTVILTDNSSTTDVGATSTKWNWKLTQNGLTQTSTTNPATFIINPEAFAVEFNVEASNACKGSISKNLPFTDKRFESDFKVELAGCDENNNLRVKLIDLSQGLNDNFTVTTRDWKVTSASGTILNSAGEDPIISLPRENFTVELNVNTNKNCRNILSKSFNSTDFVPTIDFKFALSGCDQSNEAIIRLEELSNDNVTYATVSAYEWTINGNSRTGKVVDYTTGLKDKLDTKLRVVFANNCYNDVSKIIDVDQLRPKVQYSFTPVACLSDSTVTLKFDFDQTGTQGLQNAGVQWVIGNLSNQNTYTGNTVNVELPKDSSITATIKCLFENNCIDEVSRSFLPGPFATVTLIDDSLTLCPGEKANLIVNGNPVFSYTWTPNQDIDLTTPNNPVLTASSDQTYNLVVSDGLCSVSKNVVVNVLESINLDVSGKDYTCDGTIELKVAGAVGPGEYTWKNKAGQIVGIGNQLNTKFTGKEDEFSVEFKGQVCSANPANKRVINQTPIYDVIPYEFCLGDTIKTNNVFNLVPGHANVVKWISDPHIVTGDNDITPTITTVGADDKGFKLSFTAVNQYDCSVLDTLEVKVIPNPIANFDFKVEDCESLEVCFTLKLDPSVSTELNGFPAWKFGDNSQDVLGKEICHEYPKAGDYTVKLYNLSKRCPFKDVEKPLKLNDAFQTFTNPNQEDCIDSDYTLLLPDAAQGRDFVWYTMDGTILSNEANPKVDIKSDTSFVLNVKDDNGCPFNDTINIKAFKYDLNLKVQDEVCTYGEYEITSTINPGINFEYKWSPENAIVSGGNSANPRVDVGKASKYTVDVTHPTLGCKTSGEVEFKFFKFDYSLIKPDVFCLDQNTEPGIIVNGTPQFIYKWEPANLIVSGGNTNKPVVKVTGQSKVFVTVTHPTLNCVVKDSIPITPNPLVFSLEAKPDTSVFINEPVDISVINPVNGNTYEWSNEFTGTKQTVRIDETTTYTVTATDANGCTGIAELTIRIKDQPCEESIFLPTAFSPNDDTSNDVFYMRSNYVDQLELIIYNRWGQEIFKTLDINIGWDGKYLGETLSPDVYAYWYKAKCTDGQEVSKKGNVSLIR